jgi:transmembrane sensor
MPDTVDQRHGGSLAEATRADAARWFARLRSDTRTEEDSVEFERWIEARPDHRRAYQRLCRQWEAYAEFADSQTVKDARREAAESRVDSEVRRFPWPSSHSALAVAASVAVIISIAAIVAVNQPAPPAVYETGVGEQKVVTLEDGSVVRLNTATRLRPAFDKDQRRVYLENGQAYFEVVSDSRRPFSVAAGSATVTAVGTEFDVRRNGRDVVVTLVEGHVRVSEDRVHATGKDQPVAPEAQLRAGEQIAYVDSAGLSDVSPVEIEPATAWIRGQLIFSDDPLEHVINEVNRYSTRIVRIGDDRLREIRISGVFRAGSVDTVVSALHEYFGIEIVAEADGTTTLLPGDG